MFWGVRQSMRAQLTPAEHSQAKQFFLDYDPVVVSLKHTSCSVSHEKQ